MTTSDLYTLFKNSTGVSTDTRQLEENQIFFALKGENFDANRLASKALKHGASHAVIDNPEYLDEGCILVDNVLQSLQEMAHFHRRQLTIPVLALTGSNGKTTSKELMAAVLKQKYHTAYTRGNLNNHIGVPLSLLSIGTEHEIAIVEMGANHQGEIAFLSSIVEPDYGYITNFGKAHLEGFGGVEGVIKGKSELYDFLRKKGGVVFLCIDDPIQTKQSQGIKAISFGSAAAADYPIELIPDQHERIGVTYQGIRIQSQLTGRYNFSNIAAAIAVGRYFEVAIDDVARGIAEYYPSNNRSQISKTKRNTLVIDTYNANPTSVEAALKNFATFPGNHKWVILGDMFELGDYSAEEHQRIADLAQELNFQKILLSGEAFSLCRADQGVLQFATINELENYLKSQKPTNKTILLKGSRGMRLERVIPYL